MEERKAIERLKNGDIGGLEALVRRHQVGAKRAAFLVTRDSALAEDVVQGAFLRAYKQIRQFDADRPFGQIVGHVRPPAATCSGAGELQPPDPAADGGARWTP